MKVSILLEDGTTTTGELMLKDINGDEYTLEYVGPIHRTEFKKINGVYSVSESNFLLWTKELAETQNIIKALYKVYDNREDAQEQLLVMKAAKIIDDSQIIPLLNLAFPYTV